MFRRSSITASMFLLFATLAMPTSANDWPPFGFFGNYQPYGLQSRSSVATPPYFSVHPPVYYGSRHTRPYGMSPFAMYPQVAAPNTYQGRLDSDFVTPTRTNPYCETLPAPSNIMSAGKKQRTNGLVRNNPFVEKSDAVLVGSEI